ncbi:MAG: hypothetical protein F6K24_05895 [Okeania sp. SIO2D1]|nr:hypothetical protein [Okeania sp. SIO2D1]
MELVYVVAVNLDFSDVPLPPAREFIDEYVVAELTPVLIAFVTALAGITVFKLIVMGR